MGNEQSSSSLEGEAKSPSIIESQNSPRNVLERYAEDIMIKEKNEARIYENSLKGQLKQAKFRGGPSTSVDEQYYYYPYPCSLNHNEHTNIRHDNVDERHPCHGREQNRFGEGQVSECSNSKIKGHENKSDGGACAPPRRRHMCDKNLEALTVENTQNCDDLLGNILVAAKYEGQSIVNNHPDKNNSNNKSSICTALARSFADIGDIVRGKDLFLGAPNKEKIKLEENLKKIFDNIKNENAELSKLSLEKVREYWWAIHRKELWEALTCSAPKGANYFVYKLDRPKFSSDRCGHNYNGDPLTNLDYVPQYLRWFDEWGEEFCRKRKIKLENVEKACRKDSEKLYCRHNGYDCTKTIKNENILFDDPKCTDCLIKCSLYEIWLDNQQKEFEKQKEKYEKEIQTYISNNEISNNNISNEYNKQISEKYTDKKYETLDKFLNLLKEGKYCKERMTGESSIDFNNDVDKTFSYSKHCKVCPHCEVDCENGNCEVKNKPDGNCGKNVKYNPPYGVKPTEITVLYSGNEKGDISKKLSEFCSNKNNINVKKNETWKCYYENSNNNKCKMENNSENNTAAEKITSFHEFFELWVKNLLKDTMKWENEIKDCINNTNITDCNDECNKNCVCFDKWVKQKEEEWKNVKKVFENKKYIQDKYYLDINKLFESFFFKVIYELDQGEAKWNQLKEELKKKIASSKANEGIKDSESAIELLLDHLKESATTCKDNNANEACSSCQKSSPNPCGDKSGGKLVSVKQIAQYIKRQAYEQANYRSDGLHKLKGKAHEGKYRRKGRENYFKDKLCKIGKNHSNRDPFESRGPCYGKDGNKMSFQIGTDWKGTEEEKMIYNDVYLPPRREHMCTSNLEHLVTDNKPLDGTDGNPKLVNNSFLGDVLLSAKYEAQRTKEDYEPVSDEQSICRAVRYSFADLADIIRGRDMWDKDDGAQKMERILKSIFKNIYETIGDKKGKYTNTDGKYLELREDWWEANRAKVWEAMKCAIKGLNVKSSDGKLSDHCGYSDHTPLDDYIPQKLRWMAEWAEWYCKVQSQEYDKLKKRCVMCMQKDNGKNCWKHNSECGVCKGACTAYQGKLLPWEYQWNVISHKYETLYEKALIAADKGGLDTSSGDIDPKDKTLVEFLFNLYVQNGGKIGTIGTTGDKDTRDTTPTVYSTAAGYIHEEAHIGDCKKQKQFCEKKNGAKPPSGDLEVDNEYAFRDKPYDHDMSCDCECTEKLQNKKSEGIVLVEPCNVVNTLLKDKNENSDIDQCIRKYKDGKEKYPGWDCTRNKIKIGEEGAYMPPRRQKLCVDFLKQLKGQTDEKLVDAFIKSAAAETFLSWHKYKEDTQKEKATHTADNDLNKGIIPKDFIRQMYYTFGDYRDLCMNKNIGNDVSNVENKIKDVFSKADGTSSSNLSREVWWKKHGPKIWEGMLCALPGTENFKNKPDYKNPPEDFAKQPQFLRWLTEWYDDYCHTRQKYLTRVESTCKLNDQSQCAAECNNKCDEYKKYMEGKKKEWDAQYKYYKEQRNKKEVVNDSKGIIVKDYVLANAKEYLKKKFTASCVTSSGKAQNSATEEVKKNIELLSEEQYYDAKEHCGCTKFIHDDKYSKISGRSNCCGLNSDAKKNKIKWRNSDEKDYAFLKERNLSGDVFFPSRRLGICFRGLDGYYRYPEVKDKDTLRKTLMEVAATEGYNLGQYYKEKKKANKEAYRYSYEVRPYSAMKYSFYDLRDIILGYDNLEDNSTTTEKNMKEIFKSESNEGSQGRQTFWNNNKDCVWEAMKCGYKKSGETVPDECKNMPSDRDYPIGSNRDEGTAYQFLRWFAEWGEDFCKHKEKELEKLVGACNDYKCGDNEDKKKKCTSACTQYKQFISGWKPQYENQIKKYGKHKHNIYSEHPVAKEAKDAQEYLDKQLQKSCNSGGKCDCMNKKSTSNGNNMPASLDDTPSEYKKKCNCPLPPKKPEAPLARAAAPPASTKKKPPSRKTQSSQPAREMQADEPASPSRRASLKEKAVASKKEAKTARPTKPPKKVEQPPKEIRAPTRTPRAAPQARTRTSIPTTTTTTSDVATMVKDILSKEPDNKGGIEGCNPKTNGPYPKWDCNVGKSKENINGACMPPRRIKLCINNIQYLNNNTENKPEKDIKEAFIKCSAIEIYFWWLKYKNQNPTAENELKNGRIPDEFKRIMYYTYGDYKDMFFGTDITNERKIITINNNVTTILKNENNKKEQDKRTKDEELLKNFWEENKKLIWEGMIYGLTHHLTDETEKKKITDNSEYTDINKLSPSLEEFAKRPQFLRWFTEWAEEFCNKRKKQLENLKEKCPDYTCSVDSTKHECEDSCKKYQIFIKQWKTQYEKQRGKFKNDKDTDKYKDYSSIESYIDNATHAHEYLHRQLKELCGNNDCSCMEKPSSQLPKRTIETRSSDDNDIPASLDSMPEGYENKCDCKLQKMEKPDPSLNCIDKSAFQLYAKAKNDLHGMKDELKGKNPKAVYEEKTNGTNGINIICKINENFFKQNNACKNNENPFDDIDKWDCKERTRRLAIENICIPPRRKYMCTNPLENLEGKKSISEALFRKVLRTAAYEGKHIKDSWEKKTKPKKRNQICDAIRYSFADLGDIIRGTDTYKGPNGANAVETKLKAVFQSIYTKFISSNHNVLRKYPNIQSFRYAWWDANREYVWKAMTCDAPEDAMLFKKLENEEIPNLILSQHKCGYNDHPPVDDYIPQRLRWMKEWGEYVCKILNEKINNMKNDCDQCKLNGKKCSDDDDGNKCTRCKEKCKEYTKLIHNLKSQFSIQKQKYNELYTKIQNNRRGFTNDNDKNAIEFFEKVKMINKCDVGTPDKYLDKAIHCIHYSFTENENENENKNKPYAFNNHPEKYKSHCSCTITHHPLDKCPFNDKTNEYCKTIRHINPCIRRYFDNNLETWTGFVVDNISHKNKGVLVPPRRRHLCTTKLTGNRYRKNEKDNLKQNLIDSAFSHGILLGKTFNDHNDEGLESMKYSFADYADIIKGTDMIGGSNIDDFNNDLKQMFPENSSENIKETTISRKHWWEENKTHVWNAMLLGYQKGKKNNGEMDKNWCNVPTEDGTDQFLRWLIEWAIQACKEKKHVRDSLKTKCRCSKEDNFEASELLRQPGCQNDIRKYISLNILIKNSMENLNIKYKQLKDQPSGNIDNKPSEENVQSYIKSKYSECDLELNDINEIDTGTKNNENNELKEVLKKLHPGSCFVENKAHENHVVVQNKKKEAQAVHPNVFYYFPVNLGSFYQAPLFSTHRVAQYDPKNDILKSSISVVIVSALGLIALLFMKKKFKSSVDLLRVIDIPKGDYGMPTLKSKNRYIPYRSGPYKGKTYIYMEGDSSGDEDKYIWDLSSSDITSSESEYEELDINDIYAPRAPKYKTLIEVVLEPSKSNGNTLGDDMVPTTNTFTDEEWNELKHDFVSQYLPNTEPNNNYRSADIPMNTEPNTLYFDNPEEKPFIISIHDRDLYTGKEISYNINMSTNTNNDIPMNARNDSYRGIDLINDSLSGAKPIDIYDEVLKRKENELFGTKHPKHMDDGKSKKEFTNMDTNVDTPTMDNILDDLETHNEPFYDIYDDDVYYDVNDDNKTSAYHNNLDVSSKVQIEMDVNTKLAKEKYPISDVWDI
ncbi:erythrocyte membrane protein 1 [Plasmodium falciparum RAJ116]|uniref:Erythrocyte membrane protein 1 n=1 Tax=Plasmodium falciparum RAJ116 TaxID=580058 RepID=A0A0L0CUH4_PLAFA|nr:erythrocyte membrane protein 1 [Plasmodium falciparum RAJ116]